MLKYKNLIYSIAILISVVILSFNLIICDAASSKKAIAHHKEDYYQDIIAKKIGGEREVLLDDKTRIDIATPTTVIEVEFAYKFYESIGQSSWYSYKTGKLPEIWLIKESDKDDKFILRCKTVCENAVRIKLGEKLVKIKVNVYDNSKR